MSKRPPHRQHHVRRLMSGAAVAALLWLAQPAAALAEKVGVRLGAHSNYTRVVVDFDRLVGYDVKSADGKVSVTFDANAELAPQEAQAGLVKNLSTGKSGTGATMDIAIPAGATIKHYRLMRKVVIDVYPPAVAKETAPKPPAAAAKAPPAKAAETTPAAAEKADSKTAVKAPDEKTSAPAAETPPAEPAAAPPASTAESAPPDATPPEKAAAAEVLPTAETTDSAATPPAPALPPAALAQLPQNVIVDEAPNPQPLVVPPQEDPRTKLRFSSIAPLQLAVFTRGDYLWIVAEGTTGSAQNPEAEGPLGKLMGAPEVMRFASGTAYRYRLPPQTFVSVDKSNMVWEITLAPLPLQAPGREIVHVEFDNTSGKAKLLATLKGNSRALAIEDPDAGDTLQVIPVSQPEERIDKGRRFSDVEVMPALTGMVIRPLADGINVTRINDYVIVTAPNGVQATPDAGPVLLSEDAARMAGTHPRLFDFPNWRQGGMPYLMRNRRALEQRAASAPNDEMRNEAIMNMALLYFANNFGPETLGVLRLLESRNPALARNPNFIALRGAAAAMAGHYQDALQDLSNPAIQQHPEVNLWIGYAAAATEQWRMANRAFPPDNALLIEYPPNIATPFTIYMAESALRLGRTETAVKFLNTLDTWANSTDNHHRAAIAYLKGEAARQEGRKSEAMRIWRPVANGLDRLYHTKASLALTNLELAENVIQPKEAIDRIDSLRFAWRGDGLEVQILHNLGQLKVQNGQYLDGLSDMRRAMTLADTLLGDTDVIRADMSRVVADIFIGGQAKNIAPLEAIAIHSAYGNLLPTGTESSIATLNFADFLIRVDLLEKAAELIDSQLRTGAAPAEKVPALGAKLAAVYLLDSRPAEAISALQRSQRSGTEAALEQERQMLRARALSQLNRTSDAIAALGGFDTPETKRLRADILWRARQWTGAAQAIESLLPADVPAALDAETADMVVNAAVAYKLGGDSAAIENLRRRFGSAIRSTPQANAFGVITRSGGRASLGDRDTILKIAGEVDMFKGFLKGYQARHDSGG
ncbi:MAG: tetratricopeptide repeat protein [Alphaproteobacteria bacterium]|nr:tetratricopeptide repeat protein [Alphaproteobacteria bacterium]